MSVSASAVDAIAAFRRARGRGDGFEWLVVGVTTSPPLSLPLPEPVVVAAVCASLTVLSVSCCAGLAAPADQFLFSSLVVHRSFAQKYLASSSCNLTTCRVGLDMEIFRRPRLLLVVFCSCGSGACANLLAHRKHIDESAKVNTDNRGAGAKNAMPQMLLSLPICHNSIHHRLSNPECPASTSAKLPSVGA